MPSTKKRDLPVTNKDMGRTTSCSTNHTPSSDASEWSPRVVVAGQSQAGARDSLGGNGAEAITGLTVREALAVCTAPAPEPSAKRPGS